MRILAAMALALTTTLTAQAQSFTAVTPTTNYAAETGNNTSAASTFAGFSNGLLAAGNVSKVDVHTLLPANPQAKVYVHTVDWWGSSSHPNIGYSTHDATHIAKQITDMQSRGIDGIVIDWYGPNSWQEQTLALTLQEVAKHPNFEVIISLEGDAFKWYVPCYTAKTCTATQGIQWQIDYLRSHYLSNAALAHRNGHVLMTEFGEEAYSIDWNAIQTANSDLIWVHRNVSGYTKPSSAGAFGWPAPVGTSTTNWQTYDGTDYLSYFYSKAPSYPTELGWGTAWWQFNDTIANWAPAGGRHIWSNCGQTMLKTWAMANQNLKLLDAVQIATWDDYEEGTELETGVDPCLAVTASVSGTLVQWSATGQESTMDHYTVYISTDGQTLMSLGDYPTSTHSLSLGSFNFAPGNYTVYVKATGKPFIQNRMSNAALYQITKIGPVVKLALTPTSGIAPVTVTANTSGTTASDGSVASTSINFGDGTVASGASASHNYTIPGTYTVTATVVDNLGVSATATQAVTVTQNQPPVAQLVVSPASGVAPVAVTASAAASTDPDGKVVSGSIDFGDGSAVVNGLSGSHSYGTAGTYTVRATVTDDRGATSSTTATVNVAVASAVKITAPAAGSTVSGGTGTVHVVASGVAPSAVTAMQVYIDNTLAYQANSAMAVDTNIATPAGAHMLTVQMVQSNGTITKQSAGFTMAANHPPVPQLAVTPTVATTSTVVTASSDGSSDPDGTIVKRVFDFGDGTVYTAGWASHTYKKAGTYTVKLTETDNLGASTTVTATVSVTVPRTVVIEKPTASTAALSNIEVKGYATGPQPITAIRIYVDYVSKYTAYNTASVDEYLKLTAGTHHIVLQAWDATGAVWKSQVDVSTSNQALNSVIQQ